MVCQPRRIYQLYHAGALLANVGTTQPMVLYASKAMFTHLG